MRRTKAEAEQTRQTIMATARQLFAEKGVGRTSLEQIAQAAGLTRGAISWHFPTKAALFSAMREEAVLPLFLRMSETLDARGTDSPLHAVEDGLLEILRSLEKDTVVRETFSLISLKCEYVGEFQALLAEVLPKSEDWVGRMRAAYRDAHARGQLRAGMDPDLLALESQAFVFGLVRLWLLDESGNTIRPRAAEMVRCHLATRHP